ncbi:MAG: hypothetical protein AMXMBFR84_44250 [Candidatus Hydrogenedentota bacterium]
MIWQFSYFALLVGIQLPFIYAWRKWMLRGVDFDRRAQVIAAVRTRMIRLQVAWSMAVAGYLSWQLFHWVNWDAQHQLWVRSMPLDTAVAHLVFWPFAMPVIMGTMKALRKVGVLPEEYVPGPVRTASLKPRTLNQYLPLWIRATTLVILGFMGALALSRLALDPPEEFRLQVMAITMLGSAAVIMLGIHFVLPRMELAQSYPPGGEAYTKAADALRAFRIRSMYLLGAFATAAFILFAALEPEIARGTISEPKLGLVGGSAGGLIGLAGAAVGTLCSLKAYRLEVLRRKDSGADHPNTLLQTE